MGLQAWWIFVVMTFVVSATPGPNMLLVMSHGARSGLRAAVLTMAGCMSALLCMMSISAAGLGALLHSFPAVFDALRYLGAAYLAYLGYNLWRAGVPSGDAPALVELAETPYRSAGSYFRQGLAVAASNSTNTSRLMATTRTPSEMAATSLSRIACAAVPTLLRKSRKTTQHSPAIAARAAQ